MESVNQKITVDVVIPSYYPKEKFDKLLFRLSIQDYPIHRVIIINTEREGLSEKRFRQYENVEVHHISKKDFDHGGSRNLGVSYSHADFFLCMTDDAVPCDTKLISTMLAAFQKDERIATVYARQLATAESSFDERFSRKFNYPAHSFSKGIEDLERLGIKCFFQSNVCCMYKRSVFDELQGFVTHTIFNEDMIYCAYMLKKAYLSYYEADAKVYHAHHYTAMQQLRRNFDLAVSQVDHPEVFSGIKSEGEGIRMISRNIKELIEERRFHLVPVLIYRSAFKYMGYLLGKRYKSLPDRLIQRISMNKNYWSKGRS